MSEVYEMKVIARIHNDFPTKFGIPHQSNRLETLKARIGRIQLYLADLAVFGSGKRYLVADGKTAATWRKYQDGSICNTISVSSE